MSKNDKSNEGNTYQLICEMLNTNGIFTRAIQRGLISYHLLEQKQVYEKYLCYRKDGNDKMLSYEFTASDCMISQTHVRNIVKRMET